MLVSQPPGPSQNLGGGICARDGYGPRLIATPLMREAGTKGCVQTRESMDSRRLSPTTK